MRKSLSVLGYLAMMLSLVGLIFLKRLFSASLLVLVPQALATALIIWARITFGRRSFHAAANPTEGGLVTSGPYQYIRHPIYTGVCLFATAGVGAHLSGEAVLLCALIWVGAIIRMRCEEQLLLAKYPEYRQYAAATARMIPSVF